MGKAFPVGCIADDFTGASDAASFLVQGGLSVILFSGIPDRKFDHNADAVVIALKTRSLPKNEAVKHTLAAAEWLVREGAEHIFLKYCSTFDSTKEGNIGPTTDCLLEKFNLPYTILCPALPVNKRTVENGHLYVNGIPLHQSHMKDHPLNPMWDSDIAKLMEDQGKYHCLKLNSFELSEETEIIQSKIKEFGQGKKHFYIIPDYETDLDAKLIVKHFGDLFLLTGGSGLMFDLAEKFKKAESNELHRATAVPGKTIILAGSCSKATLEQIDFYKQHYPSYVKIDPPALLEGKQTKETIFDAVKKYDIVLVYSSEESSAVKENRKYGQERISNMLEDCLAWLVKQASGQGFKKIIAAGGETSGAVTKALNYNEYIIGESIAPGVPLMIPLKNKDVRIVLKSGNFGEKDFFIKAIDKISGK